MKKRLISLLTAVLVIVQSLPITVAGKYYASKELPTVTENDLKYTKVTTDNLKKHIEEIKHLLEIDANHDVLPLFEKCMDVYDEITNSYVLAKLAYDRNASKENGNNLDFALMQYSECISLLSEIIYDIYDSNSHYVLEEIFGNAEDALLWALPEDEEIDKLIEKELELSNRYSEVYSNSDAAADLFLELLAVRKEIAKKYGYTSYSDYADECIYYRNFTVGSIEEFSQAVVDYICPLLYDGLYASFSLGEPQIPMTEDDVLLIARKGIGNVSDELLKTYDYMIKNNLYDIRVSDKKNLGTGAYTLSLPKKKSAFIYDNPAIDYTENGIYSVNSLVHEFGHFSAIVNDALEDKALLTLSMETSEVQSQGLEMLVEHSYGKMYGSMAPPMRYMLLTNIVSAVIEGCMFDQWQREVYALENPTIEQINKLFAEYVYEYMDLECTEEEAQSIWTAVPHNYSQPMYYISYSISAMVALSLYSESITDYSSAVDKYMNISANGGFIDFDEMITKYGFSDILTPDSVKNLSNEIYKYYGLRYNDMPSDAWYRNYMYAVSNILDLRQDDMLCPDEPITRSEFVGAIGKMYDYYVSIDEEYENAFTDTDNDKYRKYIAWAKAEGIVEGYDDEHFGGDDVLTREMAAAIIYKLTDDKSISTYDKDCFIDYSEVSDWAEDAVLWMAEKSIMDGRDDGSFDPKATITRAETAKVLSCYIHKLI